MVLSKRERYIALGTAAAVAILVLDRFLLTPLMQQSDRLDAAIAVKSRELSENQKIIQQARVNRVGWREMQANGLVRRDASEAEGEVMKQIRSWASDAGLNLSLLKADRSEKEKEFQKSTIRVTATGGMSQVSRFLWYIQTASIPVQFNELQVNTHKEGTDDLTLQMALGTIYLFPDGSAGQPPTTAPMTREVLP